LGGSINYPQLGGPSPAPQFELFVPGVAACTETTPLTLPPFLLSNPIAFVANPGNGDNLIYCGYYAALFEFMCHVYVPQAGSATIDNFAKGSWNKITVSAT
jgi:hypothetical protein